MLASAPERKSGSACIARDLVTSLPSRGHALSLGSASYAARNFGSRKSSRQSDNSIRWESASWTTRSVTYGMALPRIVLGAAYQKFEKRKLEASEPESADIGRGFSGLGQIRQDFAQRGGVLEAVAGTGRGDDHAVAV